jgi:dihydrofolate synthase/folylpolyglutamate synthase
LTAAQIAQGIRATRWPGRLERLSKEGQADVLLDVAHNPAGAWALRSALSHLDPQPRTTTAVFGCLEDKAFGEMAQILFPTFDLVVLTEVPSPRTASLQEMRTAADATGARVLTAKSPRAAFAEAVAATPLDGLVVVAGSVYLVGEIRELLTESRS